jgi:nitrite reductase (NADH) small subunit
MPTFVRVADLEEIPEGRAKVVRVHNREIAIFHAGGVIHAVKNSCPHRGTALAGACVGDQVLTCPGHGWQFDLKTGGCPDHPDFGLRRYRAEIRGNAVWVEVP